MDTIIKTIQGAFQENLEVIILLAFIVLIFYVANIVLGTIIGTKEEGFNFSKFLGGISKMIGVCICAYIFCLGLNMFQLVLKLIDISISSEVLTVLQVIGVFITWCLDMALEVYEKLKNFKTLKFVSYDEVNDFDVDRG